MENKDIDAKLPESKGKWGEGGGGGHNPCIPIELRLNVSFSIVF